MHERLNFIANALELRLSCTNPSINSIWSLKYLEIINIIQHWREESWLIHPQRKPYPAHHISEVKSNNTVYLLLTGVR